jgi:hypothetical protein
MTYVPFTSDWEDWYGLNQDKEYTTKEVEIKKPKDDTPGYDLRKAMNEKLYGKGCNDKIVIPAPRLVETYELMLYIPEEVFERIRILIKWDRTKDFVHNGYIYEIKPNEDVLAYKDRYKFLYIDRKAFVGTYDNFIKTQKIYI